MLQNLYNGKQKDEGIRTFLFNYQMTAFGILEITVTLDSGDKLSSSGTSDVNKLDHFRCMHMTGCN